MLAKRPKIISSRIGADSEDEMLEETKKLLKKSFPINSQTSESDKLFLLNTIGFIKHRAQQFKYIEIGSFMGGSLTPFLMEDCCDLVVSIDDRGRQQPDERGAKFDYGGISHTTMIDGLVSIGLDTSKLETYDGSIETFPGRAEKFDIAFIDGEHTDIACVRDFLWVLRVMKWDSIVVFHDSTIVHKGLAIVREIMHERGGEFEILKHEGSEMSAVFLGEFACVDHGSVFGNFENWETFQRRAEEAMLLSVMANRIIFKVGYEVKPAPLRKAY